MGYSLRLLAVLVATLAADFMNIITEGLRQEFTQMKNKQKKPPET